MAEPPRQRRCQERAPEEAIPDRPENKAAREFLKHAPSKGLWLPMGVEVKVMQCWRCKAYGHRTGDRECPLSLAGNLVLDAERQAREDPMAKYVAAEAVPDVRKAERKQAKMEQLQELLAEVRREAKEKKAKKRRKEKEKKRKERKRRKEDEKREGKRRRKRPRSSSSSSCDSSPSSAESEVRSSSRSTRRPSVSKRSNRRSRSRSISRS